MKSRILEKSRKYGISWYNGHYSNVIILTYLFVRLRLYHETQSKELKNFFLWKEINPFCWVIFITEVLPKNQFPFPPLSIFAFQSTQQSIYHHRRNAGINLPNLFRARKDRNNTSLKTEWSLSIPYRITHLSQPNYLETFPSSDGSFGLIQTKETSRSTSILNDSQAKTSHQDYLRSGFDRPCSLWQTGDGPDRLQSKEVGSSFLSSASLLQWNHQGFLARRTSPGRYSYWNWSHRTSEGLLCQIASLCKERNYSSRQWFLRPRDHRISGISEGSFHHCGQIDRSNQKRDIKSILPGSSLWSGDCRIYVSTHEMEKEVSFCCDQTSHPRRPYGTTYPFLDGQIQLPDSCHQYETDPSQYLEVLQWSSRCGTDYQRAKGRLPLGKNPNETLCSQPGLLPYSFVLLQSHQLVQEVMFTQGVSEYDA